ncbi:MAG: TRAP transporter small permease subunit [Robiginitomaculum sp.]|nr:TRAP transporter small permease subunit [Robiginitomaculum sp.]
MSGLHFGWLLLALNPILLMAMFLVVRSPFTRKADGYTKIAAVLVRGMDRCSEAIIRTVKWFSLGMVLLTAGLVFGRYVFGVGSLKGQEAVIYLHALLFLLAGGATLLRGGHVRVDVFFSKLSKRHQAIIDFTGTLVFLVPVCLTILVYSQSYVALSWQVFEGSPEADGLPWVYLLKTAIPAFAILMLLQGSAQALRAAMVLSDQPVSEVPPRTEMV